MNKRLNILVANDDGIASPGLLRLANAAARLGDVWVAAPAGQCSGMSQKITIAGEISVEKLNFPADVKALRNWRHACGLRKDGHKVASARKAGRCVLRHKFGL